MSAAQVSLPARTNGQTALVVPFRELDDSFAELWALRRPSSGMPAHITVLVPFVELQALATDDHEWLRQLASRQDPSLVEFAEVGEFPGVVYLKPRVDSVFRHLINAVVSRWPTHPPYEGQFDTDVPHLTIATAPLVAEGRALATSRIPLRATMETLELFEFRDDAWVSVAVFPFRANAPLDVVRTVA